MFAIKLYKVVDEIRRGNQNNYTVLYLHIKKVKQTNPTQTFCL